MKFVRSCNGQLIIAFIYRNKADFRHAAMLLLHARLSTKVRLCTSFCFLHGRKFVLPGWV